MVNSKKVIIIMPAYNASLTLEKTLLDIPNELIHEIILVDDASKDGTYDLAFKIRDRNPIYIAPEEELNQKGGQIIFHILKHEKNKGYGGNQKTCYDLALKRNAGVIVMLHPDYQYEPKSIRFFIPLLTSGKFSVVLGSRIRNKKESVLGGMPMYKYFSNRFLTFIQNTITGYMLSEWHTGMRGYTKEALSSVDFKNFSDDFVFDTQMLFAFAFKKYKIGEVDVPVRYFKEASSISLVRSLKYGFLTIIESFKFLWRKLYSKFSSI